MNDWQTILETHGPHVWRTVCRMVSDTHAARDCYQETFLSAVRQAQRGEVHNWRALLTTLATRRALDYLRQRYRTIEHGDVGFDPDTAVSTERNVTAGLEHAELRRLVRRHLAALPRRQAQAFWMRHVEGLSVPQIAEALGTPAANVSVLINRASKRLRETINPHHARNPINEVAP